MYRNLNTSQLNQKSTFNLANNNSITAASPQFTALKQSALDQFMRTKYKTKKNTGGENDEDDALTPQQIQQRLEHRNERRILEEIKLEDESEAPSRTRTLKELDLRKIKINKTPID